MRKISNQTELINQLYDNQDEDQSLFEEMKMNSLMT